MQAIEIALENLADWAAVRPPGDRARVGRALRRAIVKIEGAPELRALESALDAAARACAAATRSIEATEFMIERWMD